MEPFPEEIIKFLVEYIGSVDELEVLRVLGDSHSSGSTGRAVEDIARELHTQVEIIASRLTALRSRGLIQKRDHFYSLGAEVDPEEKGSSSRGPSRQMVLKVLQLYRERPVSMIRFVYERCGGPLRTFADAFRIRKDDD